MLHILSLNRLLCLFLLAGSMSVWGQSKNFILTKDGVGSLRKDRVFVDQSKSQEGLYNRVYKEVIEDELDGNAEIYTLCWNHIVVARFRLEEYMQGKPQTIAICSPDISTAEGLKVGMSVSKISKDPKFKAKWIVYMDAKGFAIAEYGDYTLRFHDDCLSATGLEKVKKIVESGEVELTASDFALLSQIEYIEI